MFQNCCSLLACLYIVLHNEELKSYAHDILLKSSIFWDITLCSPLEVVRRFGEICHLSIQSRRMSRARNQREIRWQAKKQEDGGDSSSETSIVFQRTIRRYIPEDRTLHNHRCENLKSSIIYYSSANVMNNVTMGWPCNSNQDSRRELWYGNISGNGHMEGQEGDVILSLR
jgi:hypothetical protein